MHKGLQAAMKECVIEKETEDMLKKFEATEGKDCDPQDILRTIFGNILSFLVCSPRLAEEEIRCVFDYV